MSEREDRLARLLERGEIERRALALAAEDLREELDAQRSRWRKMSVVATGAAFAGTVAYRLVGMRRTSARLSTIGDLVAGGLVIWKLLARLRRFW
jgi:hypothetical protein